MKVLKPRKHVQLFFLGAHMIELCGTGLTGDRCRSHVWALRPGMHETRKPPKAKRQIPVAFKYLNDVFPVAKKKTVLGMICIKKAKRHTSDSTDPKNGRFPFFPPHRYTVSTGEGFVKKQL